jgi:hypothetical protein
MRIEKIVWTDSGFHRTPEAWEPVADLMKGWSLSDMETVTAGVLAYEDDDVVGFSSTYSPSTSAYVDIQLVLKRNILSREVLFSDEETGQLPDRSGSTELHRDIETPINPS